MGNYVNFSVYREKNLEKVTSAIDFFSGRQHYRCLSFPLNTFLYLGSKMILYYFHNLRKAVKLFLKGCDNCYVYQ